MTIVIEPGKTLPPLEPEMESTGPEPRPRRRTSSTKKATGDRFHVINAFADVSMRSLTRAEVVIWVTLWRNTRNGVARTSYSSLARTCGCRRATITNGLRGLREKGLIEVVRRGGRGQGANVYRVLSVKYDV